MSTILSNNGTQSSQPTDQKTSDQKAMVILNNLLQSVKENYAGDSKDSKADTKLVPLKSTMSRTRSVRLKPVTVELVAKYTMAGSANTAYNSVQALSPIGVQDWSSYASLYDIARVKGIRLQCAIATNTSPGVGAWGYAFDPANIGTYGGVADVMTAAQRCAPLALGPTGLTFPVAHTRNGFYELNVKFPEPKNRITTDGAGANSIGGGWFGTSSTGLVTGWFKPYVEALGSGVSIYGYAYTTYVVEFAERT